MSSPDGPPGYEPPSSAQLLRSTLIALAVAAVILVAFVLPSEYGVDPTGVGTALGLTRMGEIKAQLAEEARAEEAAARDALAGESFADETFADVAAREADEAIAAKREAPTPEPPAVGPDGWRDETAVILAPDEATELKLTMKAGDRAEYQWTAEGGGLNFNAHGHGGGQSVTYEKGRGAQDRAGVLSAPFDGLHGWFWRNRTGETVSLTLRTRGQYSELEQTLGGR